MKNIILTAFLYIASVSLMAQNSLTYRNNALLPGDSFVSREIQFTEPGPSGPNQIWDFSKIRYTGKVPVVSVESSPSQKLAGIGETNVAFNDNGYEYILTSNENGIEERGYINKESKLSLVYTDPVIKMKYPFFYGGQFTDKYAGNAWYNEKSHVELSGDFTVEADAFGTLILPDLVLKNVLRLKTVKKGVQITTCGTSQINSVRYFWYAPGYRYPVLNMSINENRYYGRDTVVTRSAYENLQQPRTANTLAGTAEVQDQVENGDVSVIIFPNPFSEKLTYNYFLRKQLPVSIELYDMSGKYKIRLAKNQVEPEGLHSGELDGLTLGLKPGVYYIRFTFDKQVVVSKVVKI
jgi:hypothetical protein